MSDNSLKKASTNVSLVLNTVKTNSRNSIANSSRLSKLSQTSHSSDHEFKGDRNRDRSHLIDNKKNDRLEATTHIGAAIATEHNGTATPMVQRRTTSSASQSGKSEGTAQTSGETFEYSYISENIDLKKCLKCSAEKVLKVLPCLHSFCVECLTEQVNVHPSRNWIQCDLCKKHIYLPCEGLQGFEDNNCLHISDVPEYQTDHCDSCGTNVPNYKCTECREHVCTACVDNHLQANTSKNHYIVSHENVTKSLPTIRCSLHDMFTLDQYCLTCEETICARCAVSKHGNHNVDSIQRAAAGRRIELKKSLADTAVGTIRDVHEYLKLCCMEKRNIQIGVDKTISSIEEHAQTLKKEIDEIAEKMIKTVQDKRVSLLETADKNIEVAKTAKMAVDVSHEMIKQMIERNRDLEIINRYHSLKNTVIELKKSNKPPPAKCTAIKYQPIFNSITSYIGTVQVHAFLKRPVDYVEIGSLYLNKSICSIYPIDDTKAWIGFQRFIHVCKKDGTMGIRIDVGETVASIDSDSNGTIFVACKTSLRVITRKMQPKFVFQLPHEPSDLKITEAGEFIISFKDAKRVARFSIKGRSLQELDFRSFGFRFGMRINDPWKLAISKTSNIYLADFASETIGVFNKDCNIKTAFTTNVRKHACLCCDKGLLFISDYKRDSIQIYTDDGNLLQTCQTKGINAPCSIAVDKVGDIWLGSWNGMVKVYSQR